MIFELSGKTLNQIIPDSECRHLGRYTYIQIHTHIHVVHRYIRIHPHIHMVGEREERKLTIDCIGSSLLWDFLLFMEKVKLLDFS